MRAVSDRWAPALAAPHKLAVRAWLLDDATETELEAVVSGSATFDSRSASRGRCDVSIADDATLGMVPTTPASPLAPYGNEIRLERGIVYADGSEELVGLGVFRIDDADVVDSGSELAVRIVGIDRSARIIDARFEQPYQTTEGANYATAILQTLQAAWPDIPHNFAATSLTVSSRFAEEGTDRWAFCQEMAVAAGMELFFDGDGVCVLRPAQTALSGSAVAELAEGEDGVLLSAGRHWSRQGAFNRVYAIGEKIDDIPPPRGVATDTNWRSPTYYYGPFGRVPRFYFSPFIATNEQAADAAAAMLARELGTTQSVEFGAIVNPALEPGDVVQITRERAGIDEEHVLDSVTIPLDAGTPMSATTRATVST